MKITTSDTKTTEILSTQSLKGTCFTLKIASNNYIIKKDKNQSSVTNLLVHVWDIANEPSEVFFIKSCS